MRENLPPIEISIVFAGVLDVLGANPVAVAEGHESDHIVRDREGKRSGKPH